MQVALLRAAQGDGQGEQLGQRAAEERGGAVHRLFEDGAWLRGANWLTLCVVLVEGWCLVHFDFS